MENSYDTLSQAIKGLQKEGYVEDFNLKENCIHCGSIGEDIMPNEFRIDKAFRFEGMSNPDDSSVVYAISCDNHGIKGLLVDAYGAYANPLTSEMIEKLRWRQ